MDAQPTMADVEQLADWVGDLRRKNASLEARLSAAEEALRFYADEATWSYYNDVDETWPPEILEDKGERARKALATASGEGEDGEPFHAKLNEDDLAVMALDRAEPPGVVLSANEAIAIRNYVQSIVQRTQGPDPYVDGLHNAIRALLDRKGETG
jgi:hypothetical protein